MGAGLEMDSAGQPRRASEWMVALLERPDDSALNQRFIEWLAADPAHETDWAEMTRTYEVMGRTTPRHQDQWAAWVAQRGRPRAVPDSNKAVQPVFPTQNRHGRPATWRRRVAIGIAAASIAATIVLALFPAMRWKLTADHVTATAEVTTIHLADGSTVRLGPESALDVDFSDRERGVRLLRGAAFFEVAHDQYRPFRVTTDVVEATVLGTAFEVTADDRGAVVAVRQGVVRVDGHAVLQPEKLKAGQRLQVTQNGEVTHGTQPPAQIAAWLDGRLIVKDRPAGEVINALRPYYRGLVIFDGDSLSRQPLTGVYDLDDPVGAMKAVASALGATAHQLSPWVFVLSGD